MHRFDAENIEFIVAFCAFRVNREFAQFRFVFGQKSPNLLDANTFVLWVLWNRKHLYMLIIQIEKN